MSGRSRKLKQANRRLALKLGVAALAMFGFGYALVPIYDLFCEVTGVGGKTGQIGAQAAAESRIDAGREVTIEFTGHAATGLPWEFRPMRNKLAMHPGETKIASYYVRNNTGEEITGQAIPSVTPNEAALYFKKIECFCFSQQTLKPGEEREMPVRFMVMEKLPKDIGVITLSYTFFNADKVSARKYGGDSPVGLEAHRHHAEDHSASGHR